MKNKLYLILSGIIGLGTTDSIAASWNDPNVNLVQSISDHAYRDANTGQRVSTRDMPADYFDNTAGAAGATTGATTQPGNTTNQPATPNNNNTNAPRRTGGVRTNWSNMSNMAKAGAVLGIVGGAAGIYGATAGDGEHSAGDVALGTASGAALGASVGSIVPVIGTGIGAVGGAIIGGVISGSQLFSETDCLYDPVTGVFTCCHTQFNQGERYADIGDYMFCGTESDDGSVNVMKPGVRQCQQGGSETAASWFNGLFLDDAWSPECVVRICDGTEPPMEYTGYIDYKPNTSNFCWDWICIDGYQRSGNTCVATGGGGGSGGGSGDGGTNVPPENPYDKLIKRLQDERNRIINMCGPVGTAINVPDTTTK